MASPAGKARQLAGPMLPGAAAPRSPQRPRKHAAGLPRPGWRPWSAAGAQHGAPACQAPRQSAAGVPAAAAFAIAPRPRSSSMPRAFSEQAGRQTLGAREMIPGIQPCGDPLTQKKAERWRRQGCCCVWWCEPEACSVARQGAMPRLDSRQGAPPGLRGRLTSASCSVSRPCSTSRCSPCASLICSRGAGTMRRCCGARSGPNVRNLAVERPASAVQAHRSTSTSAPSDECHR